MISMHNLPTVDGDARMAANRLAILEPYRLLSPPEDVRARVRWIGEDLKHAARTRLRPAELPVFAGASLGDHEFVDDQVARHCVRGPFDAKALKDQPNRLLH